MENLLKSEDYHFYTEWTSNNAIGSTPGKACLCWLIGGRPFRMVDRDHLNRSSDGFQPQPELVLQG